MAVDQPGVTDSEIRVSGIASVTNPLGTDYGAAFDGVEAYFEMINSEGGIYGRDLKLVNKRDDQLGNAKAEAEGLVAAGQRVRRHPHRRAPLRGGRRPGQGQDPHLRVERQRRSGRAPRTSSSRRAPSASAAPAPGLPWLAKELGKKKVALLAYNVPQSADCAKGTVASFEKYPVGGDRLQHQLAAVRASPTSAPTSRR